MSTEQIALEIAKQRGYNQISLGKFLHLSNKTISAAKCGRRKLAEDAKDKLAETLDDARLFLEIAEESTKGVFATPWLDGENVDLHRSSILNKYLSDVWEIIELSKNLDISNKKCDENQRAKVETFLFQMLDTRVGQDHLIVVLCQEYGISPRKIFKEHRQILIHKGYLRIKKETAS